MVPEIPALRKADGVRGHLAHREALPAEHRDEAADIGERRREATFARLRLALVESRRPSGTAHVGLPSRTVPSRVVSARMLAQDTTPGHAASVINS